MKSIFTLGRKLVAGLLLAAVILGSNAAPAQAAVEHKEAAIIPADTYRKTLCQGFLGKSYGSVIDGIRCDCSGYTRATFNRLKNSGDRGDALKNVVVSAKSTRDWVNGSTIAFTTGSAIESDEGSSVLWDNRTQLSIGRKGTGATGLDDLELGDVVVYAKGNTSSHIAVYFGEFSSLDEVKAYLVNLGLYSAGALKKSGGNKYVNNGKTIIRTYGSSTHWRVHSTCSGIMIDNDVAGTSSYTSSFGKWKWTFDTGIQAE